MKQQVVARSQGEIQWDRVEPLAIDVFPWYVKGLKQSTSVKLAYDDTALHIHVEAEDCHSSAQVVTNNGSVYLDSCFEFFFTPEAERQESYINLEINCVGTVYLAVRTPELKRRAEDWEIDQVVIKSSLPMGQVKTTGPSDGQWVLDVKLPFDFVESFYGSQINREHWWCNFYRCGGSDDDQYAVWNPVVAEAPDFHQPLQFGRLKFE